MILRAQDATSFAIDCMGYLPSEINGGPTARFARLTNSATAPQSSAQTKEDPPQITLEGPIAWRSKGESHNRVGV